MNSENNTESSIYHRSNKVKNKSDIGDKLVFQITDWYSDDIINEDDLSDESSSESDDSEYDEDMSKPKKDKKEFQIQVFGVTLDGLSVSLTINGFQPFFYVLYPQDWKKSKVSKFIEFWKSKVFFIYKDSLLDFRIVKKKKFRGFTNNKEFKFIKVIFKNKNAMNTYMRKLNKLSSDDGFKMSFGRKTTLESWDIIDPMLRFVHIQNIKASGWVSIDNSNYNLIKNNKKKGIERKTLCSIEAVVDNYKHVNNYECEEMAPIITASFDIEADSSHGDFPMAIKNYRKLYNDILNFYTSKDRHMKTITQQINATKNTELKKSLKEKYDNIDKKVKDENLFIKLFQLAFRSDDLHNVNNDDDINFVYTIIDKKTNTRKKPSLKDMEKVSSILKKEKYYDKIMELRKIKNEHIIKADDYFNNDEYRDLDDEHKKFNVQIEKYAKKIVQLFDIKFPKIEGDKVIQIGTTVQKYGDNDCYLKHIITLGTCDPIDNAIVESYETEEEVLLAWTKFIKKLDPDIITGYNIFGFDIKYLYLRALALDVADKFCQISRIKNLYCDLIEQELSSSALGNNFLYYLGHLNNPDKKINSIEEFRGAENNLKDITKDSTPLRGRVFIDCQKAIQNNPVFKLESYSLDAVASNFMRGVITSYEILEDKCKTLLTCKKVDGLKPLNYITISVNDGIKVDKFQGNKKFKMLEIDYTNKTILIDDIFDLDNIGVGSMKYEWCENKDDVSAKDIFRLQKEGSAERCTIARYCIQDCELVNRLMTKLDVLTGSVGMSNVCGVPLGYLFLRGQGIKILSLVSDYCRKENFLLPKLDKPKLDNIDEKEGYEGAIVVTPYTDIYYDPVSVPDYNSLYPSSMISHNLSHDTFITSDEYDNLEGREYRVVEFDNYMYVRVGKGETVEKVINKKEPKKYCKYVQPLTDEHGNIIDSTRGIVPKILQKLLFARKATRGKMKYSVVTTKDGSIHEGIYSEKDDGIVELEYFVVDELTKPKIKLNKDDIVSIKKKYNEFQIGILDGLQLAYKVTANSLYGQIGASTSPIYWKDIAASTTAVGRNNLIFAKEYCLEHYPGCKVVYGDTDSLFIRFECKYPADHPTRPNEKMQGLDAVFESMRLCIKSAAEVTSHLPKPHNLEFEKVIYPFILLSKKRYVGNYYTEFKPSFYTNSMGIVLKRRDNAPIVKHIYGGVVNIILKYHLTDEFKKDLEKNPNLDIKKYMVRKAEEWVMKEAQRLLDGKFTMDKFIITKSLRAEYKNEESIAHKVLANRMGDRDPGNKPKSNDRIPFAYIVVNEKKGEKILQGDRIEHPNYINENKLKLDYKVYLNNQVEKPVSQLFGLVIELLRGYVNNKYSFVIPDVDKLASFDRIGDVPGITNVQREEIKKDIRKVQKKRDEQRTKASSQILFGSMVAKYDTIKSGNRMLTEFFNFGKK